jgi:hypothetical protein
MLSEDTKSNIEAELTKKLCEILREDSIQDKLNKILSISEYTQHLSSSSIELCKSKAIAVITLEKQNDLVNLVELSRQKASTRDHYIEDSLIASLILSFSAPTPMKSKEINSTFNYLLNAISSEEKIIECKEIALEYLKKLEG